MDEEIKQEFEKVWNEIRKLKKSRETAGEETKLETPKKISIKEFLISINPNSDVKRTVCIGYYLEKFEGKNNFVNKDFIEGFRRAKCTVPLNVPDKIQKAISNGWFDYGTNKRTYVLTITGEKAVENKFKEIKNE